MSQKIKKKNILIVTSPYISKSLYYFPLLDFPNTIMEKSRIEYKSNFYYQCNINEKKYLFIFYFVNNTNINNNIEYDGIIEIFNSFDSFDFLREFNNKFHSLFGNKFYPKIYVQLNEQNFDLKENFPILIKNNLFQNDWDDILKNLVLEIKKNKNDEFPYNQMIYNNNESKNIENEIKGKKNLFLNFFYCLILFFSLYDLFIYFTQNDFLNCDVKVNELFLYIRMIRIIGNIIIPFLILYNRRKKKLKKINFCVICIFINIISWIFEELIILTGNFQENANKNFYSFQLTHFLSIIFLVFIFFSNKTPKLNKKIKGYQSLNEYDKYD